MSSFARKKERTLEMLIQAMHSKFDKSKKSTLTRGAWVLPYVVVHAWCLHGGAEWRISLGGGATIPCCARVVFAW